MSGELKVQAGTGLTLYGVLLNSSGLVWNGATFVALATADWTTYALTLTEQSTTGIYLGNLPAGVVQDGQTFLAYQRLGGSPAPTDTCGGTEVLLPTSFIAAVVAGRVSGAGTGTETFRNLNNTVDEVVVTVDSDGNRTNVVYN